MTPQLSKDGARGAALRTGGHTVKEASTVAPRRRPIDAFYAERGGAKSGEVDFGCWWYAGSRHLGRTYRVSWIQDTGDVYAVAMRGSEIELLGTVAERVVLEQVLDGWAEVCGENDSLAWVRSRLAGHRTASARRWS